MNKIVIAEASPTIRSVADSLLRQNGYNVICASDGLQAWEIIQAEKPDLILAGLGLTSLSGLDLCKQVAKEQITGGIPVVILVGAKDPISNEDIFSCGARGQLKKPFSPKELLELVRKMTAPLEKTASGPFEFNQDANSKTAYKADVFSTNAPVAQQSNTKYTLDWSDLEDVKNKPAKTAEIRKSAPGNEEHNLEIDEDQYGLMKSPEEINQETLAIAQQAKKEEDFSWFMDEIKKEISGEGEKVNSGPNRQTVAPFAPQREKAPTPARSSQTYSEFEELLAGFNEISKPVDNIPARRDFDTIDSRPAVITKTPSSTPRNSISDEDIESLAERVAAKLAASLLSQIDKNQIVEAIRSELK